MYVNTLKPIKSAVIAFANTEGGKLFIGRQDDGSVCGVENVDEVLTKLTNGLRDSVRPDVMMFLDVKVETVDEKPIIVLSVQQGTARPYYLRAKGIRPEGVYVRQGASTVPATDAAILKMIKETSGDRFEDARAINQALSFEAAAAYFRENDLPFERPQMKTLGLIGRDNTFTNLAFLLSDQCLHTIKAAIFDGSGKTVFRDRREFGGSILTQLEDAFAYLDRYCQVRSEFQKLKRIDIRDYPVEAIREALLNAIVHREYGLASSTLIRLFDDRMEFVSYGGLVSGVAYDDIMLGLSALRNPKLANVFYRLHLIEAYGTGILKIKECYRNEKIKPTIEVSSNVFKVTLPNVNFAGHAREKTDDEADRGADQPTSEDVFRIKTVLKLLADKNAISRQDVDRLFAISQTTSSALIRKMLGLGLIKKVRDGRALHYVKA